MDPLDEMIQAQKALVVSYRSDVENPDRLLRYIEEREATVAKIQREIDSLKDRYENGKDRLIEAIAKLEQLNQQRLAASNPDLRKFLALRAKLKSEGIDV